LIFSSRLVLLALLSLAAALATAPEASSLTIDESAHASMAALALAADEGPTVSSASDSEVSAAYEHRSPGKAFLLSLLLPGLGQRYCGRDDRALAFFIGEAGLWTTFGVLKVQSNRREEDFEEWAKAFSGAKIEGYDRDEEFYQTISRYLSSDEYNFEIKFLARLVYPGDTPEVRAQQLAFIEDNSVRGDDTWEWESPEKRNDFRVIRHRSVEADRRAEWTLGALVLLRVLSGIDAVRVAMQENRDHGSVGLSATPCLPSGAPGLALAYSRSF
jgi:hypothetical protein